MCLQQQGHEVLNQSSLTLIKMYVFSVQKLGLAKSINENMFIQTSDSAVMYKG